MVAVYPGPMPPADALPTDPGPYGPTGRSAWMDVDWRAHLRFVEVAGRRGNVVDIGEGDPPVVFIHGPPGSWQNWVEKNPPLPAAGHRAVAFDPPRVRAAGPPPAKGSVRRH